MRQPITRIINVLTAVFVVMAALVDPHMSYGFVAALIAVAVAQMVTHTRKARVAVRSDA